MKHWSSPWPPKVLYASSHPPQTSHLDIPSHCPYGQWSPFTDSIAPSTSPDHICIFLKYICSNPQISVLFIFCYSVWRISSLVWNDFLLTPLFWTFLEPSKPCRSESSAFTLSGYRSPHQCYTVISNHVAKILPVSSGIMLCSCSSTSPSLRCSILVGVPSSPFPLWLSFSSPSLTQVCVQGDE